MADLVLSGLTKSFGRVQALEPLDLAVADGEFVALLGPSGCGKTTTLNLVAGLEGPSGGTIRIGGRDVTHVPAMDRDIAMVFQSYALCPHMTVARNLGFALEVQRLARAEIATRVARAAEVLGLFGYLDRYPRQLSGGQRQRVALGRALVRDPAVFLLDEPLSNLDAVLRVQTRAEITRLFRSLGTTALYVTHDQAKAMTMADRIAVFRSGRLLQFAPPLEIYRAPADRFVAGFVGSPPMTFVDGVVTDAGPHFGGLTLPHRLPLPQGRAVTVGLRPEDLRIADAGWPAEVELVEHMGGIQIVTLRAGTTSLARRHDQSCAQARPVLRAGTTSLAVQVQAGLNLRRGDRLSITIAPADLYLFDPDTGAMLAAPGRPFPPL